MAERSKCDLPYGHYGRVQFSLDDNKLEFGRALTAPLSIKTLVDSGDSRCASESHLSNGATDTPRPSSKALSKQIQDLIKHHPEIQPALAQLPGLSSTSEAVVRAMGRCEPTKGSLIAFTKVWSDIRHRSISVAAIATGATGSDLRLVQVQRQRRGWTADKASWIEVPTLYGEEARWSSSAGPILQVHATPNISNRDALLAIRLLSRTHILRPVHSKSSQESALSNLTFNHLYTVDLSQTAGQMHADVAFNPWFGQQLVLVDDAGSWTVLEFSSRKMDRVSRAWYGDPGVERSPDTFAVRDGWARVAWTLNLSTFITCTRQSLFLVTLDEDGAARSKEINHELFNSSVPILDLSVVARTRDAFAVLTKTHIILFRVIAQGPSDVGATCIAKIRHFKSPEDLSLTLSSWFDQDDVFLALLSNLPGSICTFHIRINGKGLVIQDSPSDLVLSTSQNGAHQVRDLHMQALEMLAKPTTSVESNRHPNRPRYYSFTALRTDYSIFNGICYSLYAQRSTILERLKPPLWVQKFGPATQSRLWKENFVVVDNTSLLDPETSRSEPLSRRARTTKALLTVTDQAVGLEKVANALCEPTGPDMSVEELASEIATLLESENLESFGPMRTLYSTTQAEIIVDGVQEASALLQTAFEAIGHGANLDDTETRDHEHEHKFRGDIVRIIPDGLTTDGKTITENESSLASAHDQLISSWVTSLSTNVPGWVRLAKADIARRMAAEIFLAAHSLRVQEVKRAVVQESQEETQTQEQTWDLPLRVSGPFPQTQPPSSRTARYLSQHSALPTPSPTATPSVITASSGSSLTAAPELHRLSKYTTFERPTPMVLPRPLVKVLSHWDVGKDPSDYDWLSASRHLTQQEENETEHDLTERERKRMQRRAERHILRQRKEAAASRASRLTSSQATEIMSASQPSALKVESQPSEMPASSQSQGLSRSAVAASQVMPGRFGGRPPPRKRRKQGF